MLSREARMCAGLSGPRIPRRRWRTGPAPVACRYASGSRHTRPSSVPLDGSGLRLVAAPHRRRFLGARLQRFRVQSDGHTRRGERTVGAGTGLRTGGPDCVHLGCAASQVLARQSRCGRRGVGGQLPCSRRSTWSRCSRSASSSRRLRCSWFGRHGSRGGPPRLPALPRRLRRPACEPGSARPAPMLMAHGTESPAACGASGKPGPRRGLRRGGPGPGGTARSLAGKDSSSISSTQLVRRSVPRRWREGLSRPRPAVARRCARQPSSSPRPTGAVTASTSRPCRSERMCADSGSPPNSSCARRWRSRSQ